MNRPGSLFRSGAGAREAMRRAGILTAVGIVGLIPAVILVGSKVVGLVVPAFLVYPALVLGGLVVALSASFVAVTHWELIHESKLLRISCTIRRRPTDVGTFLVSLLLLAMVLRHLFAENFKPR